MSLFPESTEVNTQDDRMMLLRKIQADFVAIAGPVEGTEVDTNDGFVTVLRKLAVSVHASRLSIAP